MPLPSPGDPLNPEIKPTSLASSELADSLLLHYLGSLHHMATPEKKKRSCLSKVPTTVF